MSTVHQLVIAASLWLADATPTPTPTPVSEDTVTPGPIGFLATAFVALVTIALIFDAVRRIRRMNYREQLAATLQAELDQKNAAAGPSERE